VLQEEKRCGWGTVERHDRRRTAERCERRREAPEAAGLERDQGEALPGLKALEQYEDAALRKEFSEGLGVAEVARLHDRPPSAIRSRVRKILHGAGLTAYGSSPERELPAEEG
jgi:hypothetical protein